MFRKVLKVCHTLTKKAVMATQFNFKCTQQTNAGLNPIVINIVPESKPTQLQVVCVSGAPILIEGEAGDILGIPVAAIPIAAGEAFNFNRVSYVQVTITIPVGTEYRLISNQ